MAESNGYCPFKTGRVDDDTCYENCQLYDEDKRRCYLASIAIELERIREKMKK